MDLNTKKITDSRTAWKTVVPLFTKSASKGEKITLNEEQNYIFDDKNICITFNNFFLNVFQIPNYCNYLKKKHILLFQPSLKRSKNTLIFSILKKET